MVWTWQSLRRYEFTKLSGVVGDSGLASQKNCHKNCRLMFTTHFQEKKRKEVLLKTKGVSLIYLKQR